MRQKLIGIFFSFIIAPVVAGSQEVDTIQKLMVIGADNAEWSPNGNTLLFTANFSGNWNIYARDIKTGKVQRLTSHANDDETPVFSPDGKHILYSSEIDGNSDIWIMNADGTKQQNITRNPATDFHPTWHPNGKSILFNSNRDDTIGFAIFTMNVDGSNVKRLTSPSGFRTYATWSPDGTAILFVKWAKVDGSDQLGRDICIRDADGKNERHLTNNPFALNGWPNWSPDGKQVIFSSKLNDIFQLFLINNDGTGLKQLIKSPYDDRRAKWSKDGRRIAFDRSIPGVVTDIHIVSLK